MSIKRPQFLILSGISVVGLPFLGKIISSGQIVESTEINIPTSPSLAPLLHCRSDAPWKVVFGHHPIYSSGQYGVNEPFISKLTPLFQKYRVQLYVNGHEHNYERTQPINGTTYLICGAGAGVRPVGRSSWTTSNNSGMATTATLRPRWRFTR